MADPPSATPVRAAGGPLAGFTRSGTIAAAEWSRAPVRYPSPRLAGLALAGAALLAAAPAIACTPAPGYHVPTNLELAADANAIILGEVVGALPGGGDDPLLSGIAVRPVAAIKGLLPGENIRISGMRLAPGGEGARSDPREFSEAHPDSYTGACIRRSFPQGAQVLFFLQRQNAEWRPAGGPFSRWAEDVPDGDAPWVALAGLYAHAALLQPDERTAMLEAQHEALLARSDDDVAHLMAEDIARQLAGPNPPLHQHLPPAPPILLPEMPQTPDDPGPLPDPAPAAPATEQAPPPQGDIGDVEAALDAMGAARGE